MRFVIGQSHAPVALLPSENTGTWYPLNRGKMGSQKLDGRFGEGKYLFPLPGCKPPDLLASSLITIVTELYRPTTYRY